MKKDLLYFVLVLFFASAAFSAQQKNLQSERAPVDGSLEATMKFIQEKLNSIGPVFYVGHAHDSANGHDWTTKFKDEASEVVANPSICRIRYHWFTSANGDVAMDKGVGFALKDVQHIRVLPREEIFNADNASAGHVSWSAKVEPPAYVLLVQRPAHVENHFVFLDEDMAKQIAKALTHAVELCGGKLSQ